MEGTSSNQKSKTAKGASSKGKMEEDDGSYFKKRERNNIAVRKSRRKAKERIEETRKRVVDLSQENDDLRSKVSLLQKELNVLRSLFSNGGISLPNAAQLNVLNSNGISKNSAAENVVLTTVTLPSDVMQVTPCKTEHPE